MDTIIPQDEVIHMFVEEAIIELKIQIGAECLQEIVGEAKLRFYKGYGNRILMHAEAVFDREHTVGNCSGFLIKAEKNSMGIKKTAYTIRYSAWDWTAK